MESHQTKAQRCLYSQVSLCVCVCVCVCWDRVGGGLIERGPSGSLASGLHLDRLKREDSDWTHDSGLLFPACARWLPVCLDVFPVCSVLRCSTVRSTSCWSCSTTAVPTAAGQSMSPTEWVSEIESECVCV